MEGCCLGKRVSSSEVFFFLFAFRGVVTLGCLEELGLDVFLWVWKHEIS